MDEAGAGRGIAAASLGSGIGGVALGFVAYVLVKDVVADSENGLWHDPDAGLLLAIPLLAWVGAVVGAPVALRSMGYQRVASTAGAVAAVFPLTLVCVVTGPFMIVSPFIAGLMGRVITSRQQPRQVD